MKDIMDPFFSVVYFDFIFFGQNFKKCRNKGDFTKAAAYSVISSRQSQKAIV